MSALRKGSDMQPGYPSNQRPAAPPRRVIRVILERCDDDKSPVMRFDDLDLSSLRLTPTKANGSESGVSKLKTNAPIPCFAVILWSPWILRELELHAKWEGKLLTALGIGRMLSEAVIDENPHMDWRKPFLLLDVVNAKVTRNDKDHSLTIPVVEKLVFGNCDVPASKRMWELVISECCVKLGLEILRGKPTTIMIWGGRQVSQPESKFKGKIHLDTYFGPVNVIIFHGEEMTRNRRRSIQGNFSTSELELFGNDFRRRIVYSQVTDVFAVHLSKLASAVSKTEVEKIRSQLALLKAPENNTVNDSNAKDSSPNEILEVVSQSIPQDKPVSSRELEKLAEPTDQRPETGRVDHQGEVSDEEDVSVRNYAGTQLISVDDDAYTDFDEEWRFENVEERDETLSNPADSDAEEEDELSAQPRPKRQKKSQPEIIPVVQKKGIQLLQCPHCPYHTTHTRLINAHLPLHEEASLGVPCPDCGWYYAPDKLPLHQSQWHRIIPKSIRKKRKKAAQLQAAPIPFNCEHCPHKTKDVTNYKRHQKVHEEGTEATACHECGIFVLPNSFIVHRVVCAPLIRNSLGKDEILSGNGSKGKKRKLNTSNPSYISFNRGFLKTKQYGCRKCPYETLLLWRMEVHAELHDEGALAVTCGECDWLLPSDQLEAHRDVNHSAEDSFSEADSEIIEEVDGNLC